MKAKRPTPDDDELGRRLREAGLRSTTARRAVLRRLSQVHKPLSHGEVAESLSAEGYDRVTVFRNLVEFAQVGIASRVDLGDHVWRFELRREGHEPSGEHPHFVCVDCGEVSCLADVNVTVTPSGSAKRRTPLGQITQVVFKGHCTACL
jgi:Fur family ferric uptake transcriptional regulator